MAHMTESGEKRKKRREWKHHRELCVLCQGQLVLEEMWNTGHGFVHLGEVEVYSRPTSEGCSGLACLWPLFRPLPTLTVSPDLGSWTALGLKPLL